MNGSRSTILGCFVFINCVLSVSTTQAASISDAIDSNLLVNSGFENSDKTGWKGSGSIISGNQHTGLNSLVLIGDPVAYAYTSVPVTSKNNYRFSGWLRVTGMSKGHFIFRISWYDAGGLEITEATNYFGKVSSNINYFQSYLEQTAPEGAKTAKLFLIADNTDGAGYFDDLAMTDLTPQQQSMQVILSPISEIEPVTNVSITTSTQQSTVEKNSLATGEPDKKTETAATADAAITLQSVNAGSLIANSDNIPVELNVAQSFNVLANDAGFGQDKRLSVVMLPAHGQVFLTTSGDAVYTPNTDFSGKDSFIYQLTNSKGDISVATVTLTVSCTQDCEKVFKLEWIPSTTQGVVGYKVFVGRASGVYDEVFNVQNVNQFSYLAVEKGYYYFAIKAVNNADLESAFSEIVTAVN